MLRGLRPIYRVEVLSHQHLRYASGLLHILLLASSIARVGRSALYQVALGLQLGVLAAALVGVGLPRSCLLVTGGDGGGVVELPAAGCPLHLGGSGRDAMTNVTSVMLVALLGVLAS